MARRGELVFIKGREGGCPSRELVRGGNPFRFSAHSHGRAGVPPHFGGRKLRTADRHRSRRDHHLVSTRPGVTHAPPRSSCFAGFLLGSRPVPPSRRRRDSRAVTTKDGTDVGRRRQRRRVPLASGRRHVAQSQLGIRTLRDHAPRTRRDRRRRLGYVFRSADNGKSRSRRRRSPARPCCGGDALRARRARAYAAGDGGAILRADRRRRHVTPQSSGSVQALLRIVLRRGPRVRGRRGRHAAHDERRRRELVHRAALDREHALRDRAQRLDRVGRRRGRHRFKSTNGGSSFAREPARGLQSDVRALSAPGVNDGGRRWRRLCSAQHRRAARRGSSRCIEQPARRPASRFATAGFAVSSANRIVTRWNGGSSMLVPTGTTLTRTWARR